MPACVNKLQQESIHRLKAPTLSESNSSSYRFSRSKGYFIIILSELQLIKSLAKQKNKFDFPIDQVFASIDLN
jgi:hypothetical protein